MAARRVCLNCGKPLQGKARRSCSDRCRKALERQRSRDAGPGSRESLAREIHDDRGTRSALREAVVQELRPVVREAIDEQVIQAIGQFVKLAPAALAALQEDLTAEDAQIRQRAYTLVAKFMLDNQHITPARQDHPALQIHVDLPRPGAEAAPAPTSDEGRRCVECNLAKPIYEFAPTNAPMCQACQEQRKESVLSSLHVVRNPEPDVL
jgi:hypothetical protein